MELTKTAEACIAQAHMQRMSAGLQKNLCVEHIFYALLSLAHYLEPPLNKPEYVEEGKAVHAVLAQKVRSIESARRQLELDAKDTDAGYVDAGQAIGRAAEMADNADGKLSAAILAKAILESPTPVVMAVCGVANPRYTAEDARYGAAQAAQRPQDTPEKPQPAPAEPEQKPDEDSDHTLSQLGELLAMLAALEDKEHQSLKQSVQQGHQNHQHVYRRTKIGFITWRGGPVSAFIQYFLFGLLVPFAILCALEYFTGAVTKAPTPFVGFLIDAFITLAVFNLIRGVNLLFGIKSKALGHTMDLLSDCLLLWGLAENARQAYALPEMPVWMRVVVCLSSLIVLLIGAGLFKHLTSEGDVTKTKIMFQNVEGTPGMIFFRFLTKTLILPLIVFSLFWIFSITVPLWLEKTFWIIGFLIVWNIVLTMWSCMALRYKASRRHHRGAKLVQFLGALHTFWGLPALVLYLHWLFNWFPMKTWVIVLLGIWGVFTLLLSALSTRSDTGVL